MAWDELRVLEIEEPVPRAADAEAEASGSIDADRVREQPLWEQLRRRWSAATARGRRS